MDSIENFKLSKFLEQSAELVTEYIDYLVWITPEPTEHEIFYLTLREVQELKDLMQAGTIDDIIKCVEIAEGKTFEDLRSMRILQFFAKVNSIKEQMKAILNAEQTLTSKHLNIKWETVGGAEKMAKYGIYNTLDILAGGDFLKWEQVLDKIFADVFVKLSKEATMNDLNKDMELIKTEV